MENLTVLRKLETYELNKNRVPTATNCMLTLRLRSKIDLFADLGKLRDAIQTFKKMHVLLRAKVVKIEDDFHFVIDENSSMNQNLENVHFLRIKSNLNDPELAKSLIDDHLLFDLVLEKTISELFDCEKPHESLWKLIILEINNTSDNERVYEFVWNFHHIIADGISVKANFPYLLNVIDKTLKGEDIEIIEYGMYPGTTHLFEKEMNSEVKNSELLPKIFVPEFINPDRAKANSQTFVDKYLSEKDVNQLDFELIDLNSGSTFSTLAQLVHISKEISNNKPINFVIGEEKFVKLLKKSKSEGVKMTTCINMIGVLATLKLFKIEKINLDEIILYTAINLRQFHSPPIDEFQFGYCVGALTSLIRNDFKDVSDDEELKANFWQFAKKNAQIFDDRVQNDNQKFANPQFRKFEPNEMLFYVGISNLGVMDTSKYECFSNNKGPFTIDNSFTICYLGSQVNKCTICCYLCTVNNKLCISSNFNSYFFDYSFVDEYVNNFKDTVDKLIN